MNNVPTKGYVLHLWGITNCYRATALAYMQRNNLKQVTNTDGRNYFLSEIETAIIN